MVPVDTIDYERHAVAAGAQARRGGQLELRRWRVYPNDTIADVQLSVHDTARVVADDRARAEAEHRNQMIMNVLNVVIHQQGQPLRETMIDFGHLVQHVEQFLVCWVADGRGIPNGDHALPMSAQRRHTLIKLPDVPTDGVRQVARGVAEFTGDL